MDAGRPHMGTGEYHTAMSEQISEAEHAQDIADLTNELRRQHAQFVGLLTHALLLLDQLTTEMRLANVTPSAQIIYSKAEFDRQMRILLGRDK